MSGRELSSKAGHAGLQPWSRDPVDGVTFLETDGGIEVEAVKEGPPVSRWILYIRYASGGCRPLFLGETDDLTVWTALCREAQALMVPVLWKVISHEAMYGSTALAASLSLKFLVLVDDAAGLAAVFLELGRLMERVGCIESARNYYTHAVKAKPADNTVWRAALLGLSRIHGALGNPAEARHYSAMAKGGED